jgi:hypothetical protein
MGILPVLVLLAGKMRALQEILGYFLNWKSLKEHQKINYPILWDGHPARPCIISG